MRKQKNDRLSDRQESRFFPASLQNSLGDAKILLDEGQVQSAIRLMKPLAERNPRSAELHALLGSAFAQAGELWNAVTHYEKALSLKRDAHLQISLGYLYLGLELRVLALDTFRQALKSGLQGSLVIDIREGIQLLEEELLGVSSMLGKTREEVTKGFRFMEGGQVALQEHAFARSIHLNRKAIRLLGDYPPPLNNLSLSLFFYGEPEEAIRLGRMVLEQHPDNIQALSNLVRFLGSAGRNEEARQVWEKLRTLSPYDNNSWMKMVEAAAIMDADEDVYRLLQESGEDKKLDEVSTLRTQFYLAIAEANTGRKSARSRLKALQASIPWVEKILEALQEGRRGLGWADRFPYFHASDLLPQRELESFLNLLSREDKMPAGKFKREVERFVNRFPQLILVGKKLLLEDQQADVAISLLSTIGTPAAYAALGEFCLSQTGDDETRLKALFALSEAGQIQEDETIRFWQEGEWREIKLKKYEITEGREVDYAPQVIDLLDEAFLAFRENRLAEAEKLYLRVLALEPRAKHACNNLGTVYARQEKHDQARALFQKAIEIDPLYVMPRCNLAMYLLDDEKVEAALEMIAPLVDVPKLNPQELAFISYVRARIDIEQDKFDQARNTLEVALQVYPDYDLAKDLLDRLSTMELVSKGFAQIFAKQRMNNLARRERQRLRITTPDPTLQEALGIYSKEVLAAIARQVIPWGGWSAFKKDKLYRYLVDYLLEEGSLARVLELLTSEERAAFELVRANGGILTWELFDQKYGNDMDESPYWQYHEPESVMGRLRFHGLLVEVTVEGKLMVSIPIELRKPALDKA